MAEARSTNKRTSGGPLLQDDVTDAITAAFFEELARVGYGRLSLDAVAKRAGVGKAAIYRRWRSKLDVTVALVAGLALAAIDVPDTGNLLDDIRTYLDNGRAALSHPLAGTIIPDMFAEATRNPELAAVLAEHVREPRRAKAVELFERAVRRGELPPEADLTLAMDLLAGPLYWRQSVMQMPADNAYCDQLAAAIVTAMASSG
jgi:AcrR family transcriptional regulator